MVFSKLGNFTLSTDDIVANNSETLQSKSSSIPVTVVEEIRLIVKRQELEIEEMRKRLENVVRYIDMLVKAFMIFFSSHYRIIDRLFISHSNLTGN